MARCAATVASASRTCGDSRLISSSRQNLALFDDIAFLDENTGNALRAIEGERCLPQVDIPIKRQSIIGHRPMQIPPCPTADRGKNKKEDDDAKRLIHLSTITRKTSICQI